MVGVEGEENIEQKLVKVVQSCTKQRKMEEVEYRPRLFKIEESRGKGKLRIKN